MLASAVFCWRMQKDAISGVIRRVNLLLTMTYAPSSPLKTVAILTRGEALSAILQMVLSAHQSLRVRVFSNSDALADFMRLTPIDLLICEFGGADGAGHLVPMINARVINSTDVQTIVLATDSDTPTKNMCERAGIDEVIFKPMSPRYLEERVLARLGKRPKPRLMREGAVDLRRVRPSRAPQLQHPLPHNVIALFESEPGYK